MPLESSRPPLAPRCLKCNRRHLPTLRCWTGTYAQRMTRHVLMTQGRTCWICGGRATTADHVIARSYGGTDDPENLRPSCARDNSIRGNTPNPFPLDPEPPRTGAKLSSRWSVDRIEPKTGL
jgi:5-methylcytosine-specific restriction endonuclease McrA